MASIQTYHQVPFVVRISWLLVSYYVSSSRYFKKYIFTRFYFPGVLVGPYLDFTEYTGLVNGNTFSKDPESKHDSPRGRKRAAYSKMATGFAFLGAFVLFHGTMNYNTALTQDFARKNFVSRWV